MAEEAPLLAIWQRVINEVKKAQGSAPDGPYQTMQLYLDIEERAVRLASEMLGVPAPMAGIEQRLMLAGRIAAHLRTRLGLPPNP